MKPNHWIALGALLAAAGVLFGAFGAHGLDGWLARQQWDGDALLKRKEWFETAARYHLIHALAIVLVGLVAQRTSGVNPAGWVFCVGIALFSGLLYAMALTGMRWLGAIVPVGGVAFVLGWLLLAWQAARSSQG